VLNALLVRNRAVAAIVLLAGVAAAAAVAWWATRQPAPRQQTLAVAAVRQAATGLLFFAKSSGCLAAEGVVLDEHVFDLGRDALVLLRDGRADVAIAYETPSLHAAFADARVRILSALHRSTQNTRLVARRDRGIVAVSDLRGRRVGVTAGTNAEFFLDVLLRLDGVPRSAVTVVDLSPDAALEGVVEGTLDAAALFDPRAQQAEDALAETATVLHSELYLEASMLLTRDDVVASRRPALEALLRGLACGERLARERPDDVLATLRERLPGEGTLGLQRQLARVQWGLGLDHVLLELLRRERDWLERHGAPGVPPELGRLVEPGPLEAAAPGAVLLLPGG
jgi:ABC-type nitrate/sulfonate/bicarbonate transport system substrate-binding protein